MEKVCFLSGGAGGTVAPSSRGLLLSSWRHLGDGFVESQPFSYIGHNDLECGMVNPLHIRTRDMDNRCALTLEWHLRGNIDTEVLFDDMTFPITSGIETW